MSLESTSVAQPSITSNPQHPNVNSQPQVAFISGHLEVDYEYFETHYIPKIQTAIVAGHNFVVGPAIGIDTIALDYLVNTAKINPQRITVYFAEFQKKQMAEIRTRIQVDINGVTVKTKVEGDTTGQRDEAMTRDSDYDILRFMTEEEQLEMYGEGYFPRVSNTEKNYRRRHGLPLHFNAAYQPAPPNYEAGIPALNSYESGERTVDSARAQEMNVLPSIKKRWKFGLFKKRS